MHNTHDANRVGDPDTKCTHDADEIERVDELDPGNTHDADGIEESSHDSTHDVVGVAHDDDGLRIWTWEVLLSAMMMYIVLNHHTLLEMTVSCLVNPWPTLQEVMFRAPGAEMWWDVYGMNDNDDCGNEGDRNSDGEHGHDSTYVLLQGNSNCRDVILEALFKVNRQVIRLWMERKKYFGEKVHRVVRMWEFYSKRITDLNIVTKSLIKMEGLSHLTSTLMTISIIYNEHLCTKSGIRESEIFQWNWICGPWGI